jgi:hypothetical protein
VPQGLRLLWPDDMPVEEQGRFLRAVEVARRVSAGNQARPAHARRTVRPACLLPLRTNQQRSVSCRFGISTFEHLSTEHSTGNSTTGQHLPQHLVHNTTPQHTTWNGTMPQQSTSSTARHHSGTVQHLGHSTRPQHRTLTVPWAQQDTTAQHLATTEHSTLRSTWNSTI